MAMNDCSLPEFDIAFQPIIDAGSGRIYSQEALVRGKRGETAQSLFLSIRADLLARADALFRHEAIRIAGMAGLDTHLNVSVMPSVLENSADAMHSTLEAAELYHVPGEQLLLQITESEIIVDPATFAKRSDDLRQAGLRLVIDDFGAGYAGLNLLADFQPEVVKLDPKLVRGIERHGPRQAIVRGIARTCSDLGIDIIAEGIETESEYFWFLDEGITLFQGALLARPTLGTLSKVFRLPK
ncbi:EAL domain-containing protein [Thioclava sp. FR2]|uniref:EAL domain-containing protein n=1 Tax=Thioclava sp. FR2 TaxID=3445780 RepID=UPI003EBDD88C